MLIVGAQPSQYNKFIIPKDHKPFYIETDFGGSSSTAPKTEYITKNFIDFPLLIIGVESIFDKFSNIKFDKIIFDLGVCYWLRITKNRIDYLISIKKPNGIIVFDNMFNMSRIIKDEELDKFTETLATNLPQNVKEKILYENGNFIIDINTKTIQNKKKYNSRLFMEISNGLNEVLPLTNYYENIILSSKENENDEIIEYKLELDDKQTKEHYTIIVPSKYPLTSPSIKINEIIKTPIKWNYKISIYELISVFTKNDNDNMMLLLSNYERLEKITNINDVYSSDYLPLFVKLIYNYKYIDIDKNTKLSYRILYNWFKKHYPEKTIKIIHDNDNDIIKELNDNTNINLILLSNINIYHINNRLDTTVFIYIK